MIKFLDLHKQYLSIKNEIDKAISAVINDSAFIGGEHVRKFEESFANYQQAIHCIGVGNGTDALEIAIESLDLPPGSEIIVPANSFIASAESVSRSGHKVVFCDVNEDDYTININDAENKITSNTAAIMAVHLYGHSCDMDALLELAKQHGLKIIEDCAQAHGAEYKGHRVGAIGEVGAFSFYPGKNLGAYGDAGAILTNNDSIALKCRMIANHGRVAKYEHKFEGRNSRLDGIQAAILTVKLKYLDMWTEHRIQIADTYLSGLSGITDFVLPDKKDWAKHVYHLFVIRHHQRDKLIHELEHYGIQTGVHYPVSLPDLESYSSINCSSDDCFTARSFAPLLLSLPISDQLHHDEVQQVIDSVRWSLNK